MTSYRSLLLMASLLMGCGTEEAATTDNSLTGSGVEPVVITQDKIDPIESSEIEKVIVTEADEIVCSETDTDSYYGSNCSIKVESEFRTDWVRYSFEGEPSEVRVYLPEDIYEKRHVETYTELFTTHQTESRVLKEVTYFEFTGGASQTDCKIYDYSTVPVTISEYSSVYAEGLPETCALKYFDDPTALVELGQ